MVCVHTCYSTCTCTYFVSKVYLKRCKKKIVKTPGEFFKGVHLCLLILVNTAKDVLYTVLLTIGICVCVPFAIWQIYMYIFVGQPFWSTELY